MIRTALLAALLSVLAAPAIAADRALARPSAAAAPPLDLSRSVTLTGHELQTLIAAQVAQAQAAAAAQAAQDVTRKVNDALTSSADPAK